MSRRTDIARVGNTVLIAAFVCGAAGASNVVLRRPATFAVDVAGTGYTDGQATMVLADGNTITVTLTTNAGAITALEWSGGYSTSGSDTSVVSVVQSGGSSGTAHVATYSAAGDSTPCLIDFAELQAIPELKDVRWQYVISGVTVTEHDTAPGSSKTLTVDLYPSDTLVAPASVATVLADRKVAGSAKTLTNAIDTTQQWGLSAAFTPVARYYYVAVTWLALTAGSSFTLEIRLTRV